MLKSNRRGKFIVIDGTDGSGKATQAKLLVTRLRKNGQKVKTIDFPRYYHNFFGKFIGECLTGAHGNFLKLSPYIASVLYAADRFESARQIEEWLASGYIVIADRYVSSNQIHQGGKIKKADERKFFLAWLEKMEFKVFNIPKPNLIIYLELPVETTIKLLASKEFCRKKEYLKGKKDMVENSRRYLDRSRESAMSLVKKINNWVKIDCQRGGQLLSKKEINDLIWESLIKKGIGL